MNTALERFSEKYTVNPSTGCWEWHAAKFQNGYAQFYEGGTNGTRGRTMKAHRWAYEHFVGPIPQGAVIDHLCRTKNCVNPSHLDPVTCKENLQRSPLTMNSINSSKTHCKRGHPLSGDNLYIVPGRGLRNCKRCKTLQMREARARKKSA